MDPVIEARASAVVAAYESAVAARDVEAFMRLYDPAVRVFDAWDEWSYEGIAAWRRPIEAWLGSHPDGRLTARFEDVRIAVASPQVATLSAIVDYGFIPASGESPRGMQNRLSWVLVASADELRIVHEHTSASVDFQAGKPILRRSPG